MDFLKRILSVDCYPCSESEAELALFEYLQGENEFSDNSLKDVFDWLDAFRPKPFSPSEEEDLCGISQCLYPPFAAQEYTANVTGRAFFTGCENKTINGYAEHSKSTAIEKNVMRYRDTNDESKGVNGYLKKNRIRRLNKLEHNRKIYTVDHAPFRNRKHRKSCDFKKDMDVWIAKQSDNNNIVISEDENEVRYIAEAKEQRQDKRLEKEKSIKGLLVSGTSWGNDATGVNIREKEKNHIIVKDSEIGDKNITTGTSKNGENQMNNLDLKNSGIEMEKNYKDSETGEFPENLNVLGNTQTWDLGNKSLFNCKRDEGEIIRGDDITAHFKPYEWYEMRTQESGEDNDSKSGDLCGANSPADNARTDTAMKMSNVRNWINNQRDENESTDSNVERVDETNNSSTTRQTKFRLSTKDKCNYCKDDFLQTKETMVCEQTIFRMTDRVNPPMINDRRGIGCNAPRCVSWQSNRAHERQSGLMTDTVKGSGVAKSKPVIAYVNVNRVDKSKLKSRQLKLRAKQGPENLFVFNNEIDEKIELSPDKSLKTNMKLINSNEESVNCSETKRCSEPRQNSIVDISIEASSDVKATDGEKWQVEIIENGDIADGISLDICGDSGGKCVASNEKCSKSGCLDQHDVKNKWSEGSISHSSYKDIETIDSIGDRNLVFKHKGRDFGSIENGQLERCFVIEDLHGDAKQDQYDFEKMSDNFRGSPDSSAKRSASEKKKLINRGQGVQLLVNVKKHSETTEKRDIPVPSVNSKHSTVISSAKAVSVKSVVKKNENIQQEYNGVNSDYGNRLNSLSPQDSHLDNNAREELSRIIHFEPPTISACGIKCGKGHIEFDLKKSENPSEERLKMENSRLSLLLVEVEKARSATVKTLLQVNTVLHKVQCDNTRLEGNLKSLSTEKKFLQEDLEKYKESAEKADRENMNFIADTKATEFESSMKIILSSWKKEKRELLNALSKSATKLKNAEVDAQSLQVQFRKVKEQLENSNLTFNKLLEHNVQASQKMENEIKTLQLEKQSLFERVEKINQNDASAATLEQEISELKENLEKATDEKDDLSRKVLNLEKSKQKSMQQCEELQDELDHSQDIVGKLAEMEENLKKSLEKETSEKTYLQDCLDQTGQILLHLRGTEEKLRTEKDELEEDLEEEIQVNESLQQSLKSTIQEHQSLINRLQDMTKVHMTVTESLQQAGKKEITYQQQISNLQRTNNILHFTLEKEKEEKMDLQEMLDNAECQSRLFKEGKINERREMEIKLQTLAENEAALTIMTGNLKKENEDLRTHLEQEEEDNDHLRKKAARLEKYKEMTESELEELRRQRSDNENEIADMRKRIDDLTKALKQEKDRYENLVCSLEDTEESLEKVTKEASLAHDQVVMKEKEIEQITGQLKEKCREIRDVEIKLEFEAGEKERFQNRCKSSEKELKDSRKKIVEQQEEIEVSKLHVKRLERENINFKKNHDEKMKEFDLHKNKSAEHLQKTKEELVGVQNQLVEKDRLAMKQKENFQDALDNTSADLKLLRDFLGDNVDNVADKGSTLLREVLSRDGGNINIDFLRNSHHKAEEEMLQDVSHLEGMLKVSKEEKQTVTVFRSPMSKIKLGEIKHLRDEMYALNGEVAKVRAKLMELCRDVKNSRLGEKRDLTNDIISNQSCLDIEYELRLIDETLKNIENNHKYLIERNKGIINNGIVRVSRENSLDELDSASETSSHDDEDKESLRRDIINASLVAENLQLKKNIELMQQRYGIIDDILNIEAVPVDRRKESSLFLQKESIKVADNLSLTNSIAKKSTKKYVPPTSMRYPPKSTAGMSTRDNAASNSNTRENTTNGYQSNESSDGDKNSGYNIVTSVQVPKKKGPSFFSAEMSMFHYDDGVAGDILRRKLDKRTNNGDSRSDTASTRSAGATTIRIKRSGSLDDEDNDEDSDAPIGQFRRSQTLPRKFKSRSAWVHKK